MALSKVIIDSTLATSLGTQAYHIVERLHDAGFDAWWVGGAVREMILEKIPNDIDIATDALPDQVASIFPKTDKTSATLGGVRVPLKNHLFEVTTFREDDEASDGRHPESVVFGKREDDAKRRDITVNALYWNPISRELYDPFDGAHEDLWELDILPYFLPELHACKGIPQPADYHHEGDVWEHMLTVVRSYREEDGIDVRMAALFHDIGKATTFSLKDRIRFDHHATVSAELTAAALGRLQMQAKQREKILWLIQHHMMMGSFVGEDAMPEERKAHWYFHPWFSELLALFYLDIAGTDPADFSLYDAIVKDYHQFLDSHPRPPKPLITGEEVIAILGIPPGEKIGEVLKLLHDAQINKKITTKKEAR